MGLSLVAVGAKITASIINAIIGAVNAGGLTLVAPSSVAGTGVTMSTLGAVSFSGATSASLNGVFTSQYDNYHIEIDATGANATQRFGVTLRASGADSSAANYDYTLEYSVSSTASSVALLAQSNWQLAAANPMTDFYASFDIAQPFPAVLTKFTGISNGYASAAAPLVGTVAGGHRLAQSFDGFTLSWSAAMSGTIRVYGYNNG